MCQPSRNRSIVRSAVGPPGAPLKSSQIASMPPGPNEPTALFEKTRGLWRVHERLDRVREVGRAESGRQIAIVPLETHHAVRQSRIADERGCELRLNRAERDASAADGQSLGEITQACAHTTAKIDHGGPVRTLEADAV